MTDDHSEIVRLKEQMSDVERWIEDHKDVGIDISVLKQCVNTYNGTIKKIDKDVGVLRDTVISWKGSIKTLGWVLGFVGLGVLAQLILSAFGL